MIPRWAWGLTGAVAACTMALIYYRADLIRTTLRPVPPASSSIATSPGVRGGVQSENGFSIEAPKEGSQVPPSGLEVRWNAVPAAFNYEVVLTTAAGDLVWTSRAESNFVSLPRDFKLQPGEKYFVWVRAHLADGKAIQTKSVSIFVSERIK